MLALNLSGGNQQKTVIAKWLATSPKLLLLDEATHGIDVGAKDEIYNLIRDFSKKGIAIIMVSSELLELLGLCDRIIVLREGAMAGVLKHEEASEEQIMKLAMGG
jgi:ribose transport system ATP-binding protein